MITKKMVNEAKSLLKKRESRIGEITELMLDSSIIKINDMKESLRYLEKKLENENKFLKLEKAIKDGTSKNKIRYDQLKKKRERQKNISNKKIKEAYNKIVNFEINSYEDAFTNFEKARESKKMKKAIPLDKGFLIAFKRIPHFFKPPFNIPSTILEKEGVNNPLKIKYMRSDKTSNVLFMVRNKAINDILQDNKPQGNMLKGYDKIQFRNSRIEPTNYRVKDRERSYLRNDVNELLVNIYPIELGKFACNWTANRFEDIINRGLWSEKIYRRLLNIQNFPKFSKTYDNKKELIKSQYCTMTRMIQEKITRDKEKGEYFNVSFIPGGEEIEIFNELENNDNINELIEKSNFSQKIRVAIRRRTGNPPISEKQRPSSSHDDFIKYDKIRMNKGLEYIDVLTFKKKKKRARKRGRPRKDD